MKSCWKSLLLLPAYFYFGWFIIIAFSSSHNTILLTFPLKILSLSTQASLIYFLRKILFSVSVFSSEESLYFSSLASWKNHKELLSWFVFFFLVGLIPNYFFVSVWIQQAGRQQEIMRDCFHEVIGFKFISYNVMSFLLVNFSKFENRLDFTKMNNFLCVQHDSQT
jgi:hypothetical protein